MTGTSLVPAKLKAGSWEDLRDGRPRAIRISGKRDSFGPLNRLDRSHRPTRQTSIPVVHLCTIGTDTDTDTDTRTYPSERWGERACLPSAPFSRRAFVDGGAWSIFGDSPDLLVPSHPEQLVTCMHERVPVPLLSLIPIAGFSPDDASSSSRTTVKSFLLSLGSPPVQCCPEKKEEPVQPKRRPRTGAGGMAGKMGAGAFFLCLEQAQIYCRQ